MPTGALFKMNAESCVVNFSGKGAAARELSALHFLHKLQKLQASHSCPPLLVGWRLAGSNQL
jgi:hypothetical protein